MIEAWVIGQHNPPYEYYSKRLYKQELAVPGNVVVHEGGQWKVVTATHFNRVYEWVS